MEGTDVLALAAQSLETKLREVDADIQAHLDQIKRLQVRRAELQRLLPHPLAGHPLAVIDNL